ncbi:MAG: hypothetical protein KIS88_02375 [Anaerolineales bacterium]|nr:hypothetical protein [Anaerolineales bacterium]
MPNAKQRMEILLRLERGEITPAEAEQLLSGMVDLPPAPKTRMGILEQVERGQLNADEAARLLLQQRAMAGTGAAQAEHAEEEISFDEVPPKRAWKVFLGIGVVFTILSALWMNSILQRSGMNFWFYCTWLPFALGVLITALAWMARSSTWVQMHVHSNKGHGGNLYLTLPLPVATIQRFVQRWAKSGRIVVNEEKDIEIHLGGGKSARGQ